MTIVVGNDGSEPSHRAVEWCAAHAGARSVEVVAAYAIPTQFYPGMVGIYAAPAPLTSQRRAELGEQVTRIWCASLADSKVPSRG